MHYVDLKPYKVGDKSFSKLLNVGWLDREIPFPTGNVDEALLEKLHTLTLFDLDQRDANKNGKRFHPSGTCIHTMRIRGNPFLCPFCGEKEISLVDSDGRKMILGRGEMAIPNEEHTQKFAMPTMLYHYIEHHRYLPPDSFLRALEAFPMNEPYDCENDGIW
jgi:predicted RNA-binding Zn-ribbon protein involved in translation (DUF1610 family)